MYYLIGALIILIPLSFSSKLYNRSLNIDKMFQRLEFMSFAIWFDSGKSDAEKFRYYVPIIRYTKRRIFWSVRSIDYWYNLILKQIQNIS